MQASTTLMSILCSLGLALGGCTRTSPDRGRSDAPDEREPPTIDPVIDWVGNPERLKPTPGAQQPALEVQDIGNPGDRVDHPVEPHRRAPPERNKPAVPPPSGD